MSHLKDRNIIIKEHIVDRNKEIRGIKSKKLDQTLTTINKIWEVKRRTKEKRRKGSNKTSNQKCGRKNTKAARRNKKKYTKNYKALLKTKLAIASEGQ